MSKILASIYKSSKRNEMYLYVEKRDQLEKVPEALHQAFGKATHVMDILLTPERTLARADVEKVMTEIQEKGFYLQMPPVEEDYIQHLPEELLSFNDPV
ncbi:YcgL domain-containing protein [Endozoicomonas arenosclerae]|uniref:YcgL domain-containing protein n=1 Tax=Endozoicomonas arenosclerae TaxID=1633495 RepID=UPI000781B60A|nr:YcgL domain-containing protein [Endozoicomonas arenosclerae]